MVVVVVEEEVVEEVVLLKCWNRFGVWVLLLVFEV